MPFICGFDIYEFVQSLKTLVTLNSALVCFQSLTDMCACGRQKIQVT